VALGLPTPDLSWVTKLRDELQGLPETLQAFRKTVEDLRKVAGRLEALTEVMERAERHLDAMGVTDTARQVDDAVLALQRQVGQLRANTPDVVTEGVDEAVAQMKRTVDMMSDFGAKLLGAPRDKPSEK
jgi:hypothetical protein